MTDLQQQILELSSLERLNLIQLITKSLWEEQLLQTALERSQAIKDGKAKTITLEELKRRYYGDE